MQPLSLEQLLLLGVIAFIAVSLLTPLMRLVAKRFGIVDSPSESHKTHKNPVPYLGGVGIAIGVVGVTYLASLISDFSRATFLLASSVLIPAIIMGIVGLIDDLKRLSPWPRFIMQSLFGIAISAVLVSTNTLGSPFGNNWIDIPISTLFIVGITNSVNFFDNIDGGASGTLSIAAIFLFNNGKIKNILEVTFVEFTYFFFNIRAYIFFSTIIDNQSTFILESIFTCFFTDSPERLSINLKH